MTNQLGSAGTEQDTVFWACIYTCRMCLSQTWDWDASSVWRVAKQAVATKMQAEAHIFDIAGAEKSVNKGELNLFRGSKCVTWHASWNVEIEIHSLTISFIKSSKVNGSTFSLLHSRPFFCRLLINTSWLPIGLSLADVVWRAAMHSGVSSG